MFRKTFLIFLLIQASAMFAHAQLIPITLPNDYGSLYFSFGLNRNWFSKNDIRIQGNDYDLILYQVKGEDKWKPYEFNSWSDNTPQFNFTLGYLFPGENFIGLELAYDHVRYTAVNQKVHLRGIANGEIVDKDTMMGTSDLWYEQGNGSSMLTLNFFKGFQLLASDEEYHVLSVMLKGGGGILLPKTNVKMFGTSAHNNASASGYAIELGTALHYEFMHRIIFEIGAKGYYANYTSLQAVGDARMSHVSLWVQGLATIGYQFRL